MQVRQKYIDLVNKHSGNAPAFFAALEGVASRLGIQPEWIADVMYIESGFSPSIKNTGSTASGLIQFMEATAKGLGTTTAAIRAMTNIQQLPLVERYFKGQMASVGKPRDWFETYLLVFYPAWVGKAETAQLAASAYSANSQIDTQKKGYITKGDFRAWANRLVPTSSPLTILKNTVEDLKPCPHCSKPLLS